MISPLRHHFTPRAQVEWDKIPAEAHERILNAVWCGNCRTSVRVIDYTGTWEESGEIRLQGFCATCGHVVVRIIEKAEPETKPIKKKVK